MKVKMNNSEMDLEFALNSLYIMLDDMNDHFNDRLDQLEKGLVGRVIQLEERVKVMSNKLYGNSYIWFPAKRCYCRIFASKEIDDKFLIKCPYCNDNHIYNSCGFKQCKKIKNGWFYLTSEDQELLLELDRM